MCCRCKCRSKLNKENKRKKLEKENHRKGQWNRYKCSNKIKKRRKIEEKKKGWKKIRETGLPNSVDRYINVVGN